MKKFYFLLLFTFLFGCSSCVDNEPVVDADFLNDLGIENFRIRGGLYLDEFDMNLTALTYEYYINYLSDNLKPSAEGLVDKIKLAEEYYFTSNDSSFSIILWYPADKKVVVDDAYTSNVDTVAAIKQLNELNELSIYLNRND